jgi:nucleotide-binding universal stress UspA family protein
MIMPVHTLVTASVSSIVVATDESSSACAALRTAGRLAQATGGRLHVVHSGGPARLPSPAALERILQDHLPPGISPTSRTISTDCADALTDVAARSWADLIVLGPARTRDDSLESLISNAPCACLIVNGPLELPLRRVLVALDPSHHECGALDEALLWARVAGDVRHGTGITVLHVVPRSGEVDEEFERERLGAVIAHARGTMRPPEWVDFARRVSCQEKIPEAILDAARREHAQLIVVGRNARSRVGRALLGSVASAVAREAELPVLLVPPALCQE